MFQPYRCPKAGVLRLWYVFPFMVQKSFSPKEKKKKFWTNAAWPFLQRIKGMFEWLFLFLHVAQRGAGSFSNQCPSLPFLEGEKMGLDARHFHPVDADRRAESCSCCYIHHLLNVFSFSIAPAAPRTLWETWPKGSLDNLREVSGIIKEHRSSSYRLPGASKCYPSAAINSLDCHLLS